MAKRLKHFKKCHTKLTHWIRDSNFIRQIGTEMPLTLNEEAKKYKYKEDKIFHNWNLHKAFIHLDYKGGIICSICV